MQVTSKATKRVSYVSEQITKPLTAGILVEVLAKLPPEAKVLDWKDILAYGVYAGSHPYYIHINTEEPLD